MSSRGAVSTPRAGQRDQIRVVPDGARAGSVGFVGRAHEINQLAATYARVADGQAATVLITGEAGLGKSRLVDELAAQAREAGATVATGCCVRTEDGLPYAPMVGLARDLVRRLGQEAADALAPLVGGPAIDSGAVPGGAFAADQPMRYEVARVRLFEAILSGFTALSGRAPLVLVVEDLHWADAASIELLDFLTRNLVDAPILIAATYRAEELDPLRRTTFAELARHPRVLALRLPGLNRPDIAAVVAARLGHAAETRITDDIWERSQGNPFFAEELAAAPEGVTVPDDLRAVLLLKVEALSADARRVVRIAATVGDTVEHALLVALAGLAGEQLDAAVGELIDAQLLVVDDVAAGYRFRHALLREAVYATLLPGERTRLHHAVATALTNDATLGDPGSGKRTALLAAQWWAAGAWEQACAYALGAADAAEAALAFRDAFTHLEHALAALDRAPHVAAEHGTSRGAILEHAANIGVMCGVFEAAYAHASAALEEYEAAGDAAGVVRALVLRGYYACYVGLGDAASLAEIEAAVRRAEADDVPARERAAAACALGASLMVMGQFAEAEPLCRAALAAARDAGSRVHEAHALNSLGTVRALRGHLDEGIGLLRDAMAIAEELADPQSINRAYANLTHVLMTSGRLAETATMTFDCSALGEHMWGVRFNGSAGNSVEAMVRLGRYDDALDLIAQLGDSALGVCVHGPVLWPAPIAIRRGELARAQQLLVEADRLTAASALQDRGRFLVAAAELALVEGRIADAWRFVEDGLARAEGSDETVVGAELAAVALRVLADAAAPGAQTGLGPDPATRADAILALVQRLVADASQDGAVPSTVLLAFAAMAAAERSRLTASDADLWAAAAGAGAGPGLAWEVAYCRWREAEALLEGKSNRPRAVEALTAAAEGARTLGAAPLLANVEQLARRARIALSDGTVTEDARPAEELGLTPRELEVLAHLAQGSTDQEIADALFISRKTASVHVSNLLRKLGVANRVEAGKIGQARGVA